MPTLAPAAPAALADLARLLSTSEGYAPLAETLRAGRSGAIDGAWGSSAALSVATLSNEAPPTLLVVIAHPGDLDAWSGDLRSFSGKQPALFPALDVLPGERPRLDAATGARLRLIQQLASAESPRLMLTTVQALMQPVPARADLAARGRLLRTGETLDVDELSAWLVEHGYKRVDAVEMPAEFSRRGGIFDVYSPDADAPLRLELFGDEVEAIRQFAADTQRSLRELKSASVLAITSPARSASEGSGESLASGSGRSERGHLSEYLPPGAWVVLVEPDDLRTQGAAFLDRVADTAGLFSVPGTLRQLLQFPSVTVAALPTSSVETTWHLRVESVERFSGNVQRVRDELDGIVADAQVFVVCHNDAECKRLGEVLSAGRLAQSDRLRLARGHVRAGFRLVESGVVILGSHELFHREDPATAVPGGVSLPPRRKVESRAIDSFLDLAEGDLVVHVSQGIARFRGMVMLDRGDQSRDREGAVLRPLPHGRGSEVAREEHLLLEFRGGVHVYVPASKIDLVQKYVGGSKTEPELSKFGGTGWGRRKERVEAAVHDMAAEMLQMQAVRAAQPGLAFPPDSDWQREFEASFPYRETPDQLTSLREIKADMERSRPMDRLLCGDVGYGKTELAVRAAFKAVDNGKQVAVLVPTTVLAEQHLRTFSARLSEYPFMVEGLSRFKSHTEQKRTLQRVAAGEVDVIIGTHRLVSEDVHFKDLGLVIIDEEQRFGVEHKERLKRLRAMVDVLTLTATPIPRTLHLALLGIRDISNLETPPPERLPVETRITRFDRPLIRQAILRELNREGQVYFVHNRVQDIHATASEVRSIVPEAKVVVAHGQQTPDELERAMVAFVQRQADVLVATTIIESGLDIPNANTIFIDEADRYGLADLHQLRGRVGRHKNRAYAYLLLSPDRTVTPEASRRLKAIEEFTELGAGFKIALRDLEIRGAGNILGAQQSGHIAAVGYELYCQLLENSVRQLKQLPAKAPLEVNIDLPWPAYLPHDYVPGAKQRLEVYRRLARVRDAAKLDDFRQELRDRYGPPPETAEWLLRQAELRILAAKRGVTNLHRIGKDVVLTYRSKRNMQKLAEAADERFRIVDEKSAYYRVRPADEEPLKLFAALRSLLTR
ncbi:MAG TPA: transcription-repair coupling factor [Gemmataceae bacterium]|jgi:transcription-repair coupling factor (superfamily II helicase)|nr:transcription-repair coupling factor [Gemmataceae bacterium]